MVPQRSPMGGSADWGMSRSGVSPVGSAGHPSMMRPGMEYSNSRGMMSGPMIGRSNSVPGTRSMLQQQLMDMGTSLILYWCWKNDPRHSYLICTKKQVQWKLIAQFLEALIQKSNTNVDLIIPLDEV